MEQQSLTPHELTTLLDDYLRPHEQIGAFWDCPSCGLGGGWVGTDYSSDMPSSDVREVCDCGARVTWTRQFESEHYAAIKRLQAAAALVAASQRLMAETVAEMRAVRSASSVMQADGTGEALRFSISARKPRDRATSLYSWSVIGAVLGVTAQAAQARFGSKRGGGR